MTDPLQDPGVQGLAQLGRNAIERVAQLEEELATAFAAMRDQRESMTKHANELYAAIMQISDERDRLRAELAGYVEANRHMAGELDDALEDARKYCEAQREIARLEDQMVCLKEFRMDGLGVDMRWSGDAANALMQMLAAMMLDIPNYLESTLTIAGHGESYVMTIRKHDGKTPHAMRAEADAEIARLRHEVAKLCGYDSADEMDAATGRRK